jgi:hypothetical protein
MVDVRREVDVRRARASGGRSDVAWQAMVDSHIMHTWRMLIPAAALAVAGLAVVSAAQADPQLWLDDARAAMGGAAIQNVSSLRIQGTWRRTIDGFGMDGAVNIYWQAPDRFVREEEQTMVMGTRTRRNGFNGDRRISETISPNPLPAIPSALPEAVVVGRLRQELARLLLPLTASASPLPATHPLTIAAAEQSGGDRIIVFRGPDGSTTRLTLDAGTQLPSAVAWTGRPVAMRVSRSVVAVPGRPGGPAVPLPAPTPPAGDPTIGMADVEYRMTLTDYRAESGITWPRRITTTIDDKPYEEIRVRRYHINPDINERTFR